MPKIITAETNEHLAAAGVLFSEYAASLPFALDFQGFAAELAELPGKYAAPAGTLLLLYDEEGQATACVAVRPLSRDVCEMKRLYVRPASRGKGWGRLLAKAAIDAARLLGYRLMRLDSTPAMAAAIGIYQSLGFKSIPPYCHNPLPGAIFLEKDLSAE
jgi:GNAT superfamily N-acetyltransferase